MIANKFKGYYIEKLPKETMLICNSNKITKFWYRENKVCHEYHNSQTCYMQT